MTKTKPSKGGAAAFIVGNSCKSLSNIQIQRNVWKVRRKVAAKDGFSRRPHVCF